MPLDQIVPLTPAPPADPDGVAALRALLGQMVAADASDLHVRAGEPPRIRVSGDLVTLGGATSPALTAAIVRAALDEEGRAAFARDREHDTALDVPGVGRFRVNAFRARGEDGCVLRRIGDEPVPLDRLGMPDVVRSLALRPRGLVLVTGPTGSGKTTTLAGMIDAINRERPVHVLTLEDPIEVVHRSRTATVTQRELGSDVLSWSGALRAALRQDPDVILIGEMRDAETVHAALAAAETGHLVLSTLHTTDALETVQRVIDFFPPHEQSRVRAALASCLQGVVCQRLVPDREGGRVCVLEIGVVDARVSEVIADAERTAELPDVIAESGYSGMQTFDQHLLRLVEGGVLDAATAHGVASRPHDFLVMLRRTGWRPEETHTPRHRHLEETP